MLSTKIEMETAIHFYADCFHTNLIIVAFHVLPEASNTNRASGFVNVLDTKTYYFFNKARTRLLRNIIVC
jgi:hypothetical protein